MLIDFEDLYNILNRVEVVHIYDATSGEMYHAGVLGLIPHPVFEAIKNMEVVGIHVSGDEDNNTWLSVEVND